MRTFLRLSLLVLGLLPGCWADFPESLLVSDGTTTSDSGLLDDGGGIPVLAQLGELCFVPGDCFSGHCVSSVCCESACAGACEQCSSTGRCTAVAAGQNPPAGKMCTDETGINPCGTDGRCDGFGACRRVPGGTICAPPVCNGSQRRNVAQICDGLGTCVNNGNYDCAPYRCDSASVGDMCFTTCNNNNQCQNPATCNMGQNECGSAPNVPTGAPCTMGTECASGFCVGGVCCETACIANCRTCTSSGAEGKCVDVPFGAPPPTGETGKACSDQTGSNACGLDGLCDGAGACRMVPTGRSCGVQVCRRITDFNYRVFRPQCDGQGNCCDGEGDPTSCDSLQAEVVDACGDYRCAETDPPYCYERCTTNAECISGATCGGNNLCVP